MVDIFKNQICNYCENTECEKNKLVETEIDGLKIYKCLNYKRKSSKKNMPKTPSTIKFKKTYRLSKK